MKQALKSKGRHEEAENLERTKVPHELEFPWLAFVELNVARGSSGFGPAPIPYSEILAWSTLNGVDLDLWEINLIRRLDMAFMSAVANARPSAT